MPDISIRLPFTKMTGAGNDFILIDDRGGNYNLDWESVAKAMCDRHFGVGADGLLVIRTSAQASFRMNYYNADGSYGGMCGNGGRCAALYMMDRLSEEKISLEALSYTYDAYRAGGKIRLRMKAPGEPSLKINLKLFQEEILVHFIDTGSPHTIVFLSDLSAEFSRELRDNGINRMGFAIRNHPQFQPNGTNVNFVEIVGDHSLRMRTYERGVEGETLACGTGAVASAIITSCLTAMIPPIIVETRSHDLLEVRFRKEGSWFVDIDLIGSASVVFVGEFMYVGERQD